MISFYLGGQRSGKSRQAYAEAESLKSPVVILTFGDELIDEEFAERIKEHKRDRSSDWATLELHAHIDELSTALKTPGFTEARTVVVDCLGTLLGRIMQNELSEYFENNLNEPIPHDVCVVLENALDSYILALVESSADKNMIVVSNEVGWGLVPTTPAGRLFVDVMGRANQKFAGLSDHSYFVLAGKLMLLK